jgi:hypothetical protein
MIQIAIMTLFLYLIVKNTLELNSHTQSMLKSQIDNGEVNALKICFWVYIPGMILTYIPISIYTHLIGMILFIPGIIFGYIYSRKLETSGTDYGVNAGRAISNVMWLGVGILVLSMFVTLIQAATNVNSSA